MSTKMVDSSLDKRFDKAYASRNSGGTHKGIIDWGKIEGDVKFYKLKEGVNKIDIIPYIVKSKNHPLLRSGDVKIGGKDYVMDIWVHKSMGPAEVDVVCMKKNYGKACAVCDQAEEYRKAGKTDEADAYKARRRVFYNIQDVMNPALGVQILEQSHWYFEKELVDEARVGDELVRFYDPENGKSVKFRGSVGSYLGRATIEPKNFSFVDREASVTKLIADTVSFDECLILYTPDEMMAIMNGTDGPEDEGEEPSEKPSRSKAQAAEDDEDTRKPHKDVEEEDTKSAKCPHGHKFGKDNDEHKECDDCKVWKDCARAAK